MGVGESNEKVTKQNGGQRGETLQVRRDIFYFLFLITSLDHWNITRHCVSLKKNAKMLHTFKLSLNITCLLSGDLSITKFQKLFHENYFLGSSCCEI